jgi:DnaA-homolog protein
MNACGTSRDLPGAGAAVRQLALDLEWAAPMTFANYIEGRNQELLHQLQSLASGRSSERAIYVWGERGCGRTHLARALLSAVAARGATVAYVTCCSETALPAALAEHAAVALDDVDALGEAGQIALFHLYNALRETGALLVATGGVPPVELALREDLATRLGWGLVYQVHPLTDTEKSAALIRHAAARGFNLTPEVTHFLLTRIARDMGTLLAALERLDRHALESKRAVTLPLARAVLEGAADAGAEAANGAGG